MTDLLLDGAGRRRSPATMPGFHAGRPPRNRGMRYPADPPTIEEIVAVMRAAGDNAHGRRLRALIVVLWRAGLRIHEAPRARRVGPRPAPRRAAGAPRKGEKRRGGRDGRVGLGAPAALGLTSHPAAGRATLLRRQGSNARAAVGPDRRPRPVRGSPPRRGCDGGSLRINCATPMRSRWRTKALRSTSSSASSATPTSASPGSTYEALTTPRSSTPSTGAGHR